MSQPWLAKPWTCRLALHRWYLRRWDEGLGPGYLVVRHSEWACKRCDSTREAK